MSLLDSVIGALANAQPGAQPPSPGATQGTGVGGLGDLVGRFTQGGMGDVIGSWIGQGQNAPISGTQLSNVLGSDVIGQIASQLGLSHGDAAGQLSQMLPEVINRLTPHGQAPSGGLGASEDILASLLAKR